MEVNNVQETCLADSEDVGKSKSEGKILCFCNFNLSVHTFFL